jgi:hypothetical protein
VNKRKTPPGANPAAKWKREGLDLGFHGIAAFSVLALSGRNHQAHLPADDSRQEPAQAMRLPARQFQQFLGRGALGPFSSSRIVWVLLPSQTPFSLAAFPGRAPLAFFVPLAGLAFFPDLALDDATLRARLAAVAFFAAFGLSPVAVSWAVSVSSTVVIMLVSP